MKIIGLTGGIGSGKTTVAQMFKALGVPVYNSDERARELMATSGEIREQIIELLGEQAYEGVSLNRGYIAGRVFGNKELLTDLNQIVHPAVREDFKNWAKEQQSHYVIQEAAILFENDAYHNFDKMILVTAPKKIRLERIMLRDHTSEDSIMARMNHQWEDDKKIALSDFVIENIDLEKTEAKVAEIHSEFMETDLGSE